MVKNINTTKYRTPKHQKYLLFYHIVFVSKYRKKIFTEEFIKVFKEITYEKLSKDQIIIEAMEIDSVKNDHIHLLLNTPIEINIFDYVKNLKSYLNKKVYSLENLRTHLRKYYWERNLLFSEGIFICTVGNASLSTIQQYIDSQG